MKKNELARLSHFFNAELPEREKPEERKKEAPVANISTKNTMRVQRTYPAVKMPPSYGPIYKAKKHDTL